MNGNYETYRFHHKYRMSEIKNKKIKIRKRNKINVTLLLLLIIFIASTYTIYSLSVNRIESIAKTEQYLVKSGDTLWSIAMQYKKPEQDPREYIYNVVALNNLDTSTIYSGQILEIYLEPK